MLFYLIINATSAEKELIYKVLEKSGTFIVIIKLFLL